MSRLSSASLFTAALALSAGGAIGYAIPVPVAPDGGVTSTDGGLAPLVSDVQAAAAAEAKLKAASSAKDTTAIHMALAALIASVLKLLLDLLQRLSDVPPKVKRFFPLICAALSVGITVLAKYAAGSTWPDALIVGVGGGLGATLVNELHNMIKAPPPPSGSLPVADTATPPIPIKAA